MQPGTQRSLGWPSSDSGNYACSHCACPNTGPHSGSLPQAELVERLIVEDISPVDSKFGLEYLTYIAAMRAVDIPDKVPHSHARKLADEQLSHVVQVMPPNPQV